MIFKMPSCGGCRTCEIACSFKHTGEFVPSISSIRILDREDELGFDVRLIEKNKGKAKACDGCPDISEPLCLQYCEKYDDLKNILEEFLNRRK